MSAAPALLAGPRRAHLVRRCTALAALPDREFAVRLLAATPTHEHRDPALLARWAEAATAYGTSLARPAGAAGPAVDEALPEAALRGAAPLRVVERDGGLAPDRLLMARYTSRPPAVELFTDTLALADDLVALLGWRDWYPPGSVRAAALAHERAHRLLHRGRTASGLRRALDHVVLAAGPLRLRGHVAGAGELAAHAYAHTACGLGRSPLLLTAALGLAATPHDTPPHGTPPHDTPPPDAHTADRRSTGRRTAHPRPADRRES